MNRDTRPGTAERESAPIQYDAKEFGVIALVGSAWVMQTVR